MWTCLWQGSQTGETHIVQPFSGIDLAIHERLICPIHLNVLKKPIITTFKQYFKHKVIWKPNAGAEFLSPPPFLPYFSSAFQRTHPSCYTSVVKKKKKKKERKESLQLCVSGWKILLKDHSTTQVLPRLELLSCCGFPFKRRWFMVTIILAGVLYRRDSWGSASQSLGNCQS